MFDMTQLKLDEIDLTQEAPVNEPERQYYFIAKGRKCVKAESERLGRPLYSKIATFGCQMNARDSEKLNGILEMLGYHPVDTEEADFVIYNTCTVRENANNRVYGRLGYLNTMKKKQPHMKICLCGCMMQEQVVVDKIKKSYSFVDLIFGTHNIYKFAELFVTCFEQDAMVVDIWADTDKIVEALPVSRVYPFKSGVNIMFGCNNFCSYCIVPYVRGRERSRDALEILHEIEKLAGDGVIEVMLLGQNVNSYGKNLDVPMTFAQLLAAVEEIDSIKRIRFMTSHPKDLSAELIQVMAASAKICRHIHLPLQSGSSRILKEMNRSYTKESYLALVDKIRLAMPDIAITTDIIVGFPGETEDDFAETMDVVEQVAFDNAFTFLYSKRTGTPAAALACQVSDEVAKARFERLLQKVQEIAAQKAMTLVGRTLPVLVEEKNDDMLKGRLDNNTIVHFVGTEEMIGKICKVYLTECKGFYYFGEQSS